MWLRRSSSPAGLISTSVPSRSAGAVDDERADVAADVEDDELRVRPRRVVLVDVPVVVDVLVLVGVAHGAC